MFKKLIELENKINDTKNSFDNEITIITNNLFYDTFTLLEEIGFIQNYNYTSDYFFVLEYIEDNKHINLTVKISFSNIDKGFYIYWKDLNNNETWEKINDKFEENIKSLNKSIATEYMKYKPFARLMKLKRIIN